MTDVIETGVQYFEREVEPEPVLVEPRPHPLPVRHEAVGPVVVGPVVVGAVAGGVVGPLLFTVFIGLLGRWTGLDGSGSLFIGMFTGLWGGLGFGAMVGSIVAANRDERKRLDWRGVERRDQQ